MEVTLTVEDASGKQDRVTAAGKDYPAAYEAARALIPEGSWAIAIRTNDAQENTAP